MGGISIWQLAIILVIVLLLFGTKRLRNLGSDLGSALKGFKKAVNDDDADFTPKQVSQQEQEQEQEQAQKATSTEKQKTE